MAAPPSVSNVRIVGDTVEGSIIKGVGHYFGGREGPSKFEWLRKNRDAGLVFFSSCFTEGRLSLMCAFEILMVNYCINFDALEIVNAFILSKTFFIFFTNVFFLV